MGAEAVIFLASAFEGLAACGRHAEGEFFVYAFADVAALGYCEVFATAQEHFVGHPREAFAEAQEVYGVEHVAFAHAVVAEKAGDFARKLEPSFRDVLEICK